MKQLFKLQTATLMFIIALVLVSCEDHQARYDDPPWLGGSNIETLEKKGNYDIFLELMDSAGYRDPITKQLFTLFVPSDSIFEVYFQENNIESVKSLTKDEAFQLFTLHVLRNPRSRYDLIYEFVWNEEQGPDGEYASLFFRKPTPSTSTPYKETVRYNDKLSGQEVNIYTGEKMIPLLSLDYFEDFFGATDGSDYQFMYPNSTWDNFSPLANKAMNWHNARVLPNPDIPEELEVRTSSGFIYFIDQVVPPMPSIEEYLIANQDRFGMFYDLMQRFATYGNTKIDEYNQVFFRKGYDLVMNIAEERGPNTGNEASRKDMFTAFIPNDQVLGKYFDDNILNTYGTVENVPRITLFYILQSQLSRSLGLISKLEKSYFNAFGDPTKVSRNDIESAFMCSNGLLYETNKVMEPNVFTCVPGKMFFDQNYSIFLYALNATSMLTSLSSEEQKVTLFAPTNEQLEANNLRYDWEADRVEYKGLDNTWRNANTGSFLDDIVQDHIYYGELPNLNGEGYIQMASGNYLHYKDNKITGAGNKALDEIVEITSTEKNEKNGYLHNVNNSIKGQHGIGKEIFTNPEFASFAKKLKDAGLNRKLRNPVTREVYETLKFVVESKEWTGFIPDNNAIANAEIDGLIPPKAEKDSLKQWCMHHFIRKNAIFDNGDPDGTGVFETNMLAPVTIDGPKYNEVLIYNALNMLTVTDVSGQVISVDHDKANILVTGGVLHPISTVFKY